MRRLGIALEILVALLGMLAIRAMGGEWPLMIAIAVMAVAATVLISRRPRSQRN